MLHALVYMLTAAMEVKLKLFYFIFFMKLSGTIKAPDGPSAWTSEIERWIVFGNITGLNINGRGHFDGNGQKWWDQSCKHHPGKVFSDHPCK